MASTYTEKRKQEQASAAPGYRGTSAATQQQLTTLQQGYKPSQNVQNAQQQLTQVQTVKPTAYTSLSDATPKALLCSHVPPTQTAVPSAEKCRDTFMEGMVAVTVTLSYESVSVSCT